MYRGSSYHRIESTFDQTPITQSAPLLWLSAIDRNSIIYDANNGNKVSEWVNLGSGGVNATNLAVSTQPAFVPAGFNGREGIDFDNAYLGLGKTFSKLPTRTVIALIDGPREYVIGDLSASGANSSGSILLSYGIGYGPSDGYLTNYGNSTNGGSTAYRAEGAVSVPERFSEHVIGFEHANGQQPLLRVNGQQVGSQSYFGTGTTVGGPAHNMFVGKWGDFAGAVTPEGVFAQILIWDRLLSNQEHIDIINSLNEYYEFI